MIARHRVSEVLLDAVREVEDGFKSHYSGAAPNEEALNGYLTLRLADEFEKSTTSSERIHTDASPYKKREEKKSGADLGIRYQLSTDRYLIESGVIIQAKKDTNYDRNLPLQCFKMLTRTEESYVFQYTTGGINVYPARPIYYDEGQGGKFSKYYEMSFEDFFKYFFEGFFGEPAIARQIDHPSDVDPLGARIKYLVDVKINASSSYDEEIFDYIGDGYYQMNRDDFQEFDLGF